MAKYDVFEFGSEGNLVINVQADMLDSLNTSAINSSPETCHFLNPIFEIADNEYGLTIQFLSAVSTSSLNRKVGSIEV